MNGNPTYKIIRFYRDDDDRNGEVVRTGLTLAQAQEHCSDVNSSSSTCTTAEGLERACIHGPWFDGYTEE